MHAWCCNTQTTLPIFSFLISPGTFIVCKYGSGTPSNDEFDISLCVCVGVEWLITLDGSPVDNDWQKHTHFVYVVNFSFFAGEEIFHHYHYHALTICYEDVILVLFLITGEIFHFYHFYLTSEMYKKFYLCSMMHNQMQF